MFDLLINESNASLYDKPEKGRILCLDLGDRRIGMAVSDPLSIIAQGLPTLTRSRIKKDIKYILEIIAESGVNKVLYGLPKNMNGTLGPQAIKTEGFIEILKRHTDCLFIPWDERLTSQQAIKTLKDAGISRKKRTKSLDKLSAVLILQNYLDSLQ